MSDVIYKDKKSALKAKVCYICEKKMNGAYVVATIHGNPKPGGKKELHFPMCSSECLEEFGYLMATIDD